MEKERIERALKILNRAGVYVANATEICVVDKLAEKGLITEGFPLQKEEVDLEV